jgi:hypothetical protein
MSTTKPADSEGERRTFSVTNLSDLECRNAEAETVTYKGRQALRLIESAERIDKGYSIAIISNTNFQNGVIETEIAGMPRADAPPEMRGFVGIAFRVQPMGSHFECIFIRPTNGRANDQFRRNHATQYISQPDYPWYRLREETPSVYESYTDLQTGEWTKIRIDVSDVQAQLYVNGADQPCLIVNDLKLGTMQGNIALWIGAYTEAHFSDIIVTSR